MTADEHRAQRSPVSVVRHHRIVADAWILGVAAVIVAVISAVAAVVAGLFAMASRRATSTGCRSSARAWPA
jgi:hypothetical protein